MGFASPGRKTEIVPDVSSCLIRSGAATLIEVDIDIENAMHPEMVATRKMGAVCFMDMGYHADCEISSVGQEDFA